MEVIGLIVEYNPFHNGHIYHINKIKEKYPHSLLIAIVNGYFLERGEVSIISKENKTKIALENNIDIVIELPFFFGSQSADIFSHAAIFLLNELKVNRIIFGSESNNINKLENIAKKQINNNIKKNINEQLKTGNNYPTVLNKILKSDINTPNDILGISYIKTILKNNYNIKYECLKRTNDYHDLKSCNNIISASNIRNKIKNNQNKMKFADSGIEALVYELEKRGINRKTLKAKIAGGAKMFNFSSTTELGSIGEKNIIAVRAKLKEYGIRIISEDVGLSYGRTIVFDPETEELTVVKAGKQKHII